MKTKESLSVVKNDIGEKAIHPKEVLDLLCFMRYKAYYVIFASNFRAIFFGQICQTN